MRLTYSTCDYCGDGTHKVRFDGGGYCSCECASAAELARRRAGRELRTRQIVARQSYQALRERQADVKAGLTIGLAVVALALLAICSGCDAPSDHIGPDERGHIAHGRAIGGIE